MREFGDFVREIVREFAFLCGNFLKNLAMVNFLRFWVNFGLFFGFSSDFLSFKELRQFFVCSGNFGIFGGSFSVFRRFCKLCFFFRATSAFLCIFFGVALSFGGYIGVLRCLLVDTLEFRVVSVILVC